MRDNYTIRLSDEEKNTLKEKSKILGYNSPSNFARKLIQIGLQGYQVRKADEHILFNSAQSVILIRELISLLAGDSEQSSRIIQSAKLSADEWLNKFKSTVSEQSQ